MTWSSELSVAMTDLTLSRQAPLLAIMVGRGLLLAE